MDINLLDEEIDLQDESSAHKVYLEGVPSLVIFRVYIINMKGITNRRC